MDGLQLLDGLVAFINVLVNGREGSSRFQFLSSAAFLTILPELSFGGFSMNDFPKPALVPVQGLCMDTPALTAAHHKANPSCVSSCSPTFLSHLPGFPDLLLQLLFPALEVILGDVFLIYFALSLCPIRYRLSVRNTRLHSPDQHLLLLQQLPMADLPFAKTQTSLKIPNAYQEHQGKLSGWHVPPA